MEKGVNIKNYIKKIFILLVTFITIFSSVPIVSFSATADDDDDEKLPALVPAVANSIISKYVKTNINANSSSSGNANNNIITDNSDSGDGWSSVTEVNSTSGPTRKYRNYKQYEGSYSGNSYWGGTIADSACGPTAVAIVLSGYGYNYDPGKVVNIMQSELNYNSSDSFHYLTDTLKHIANIESEEHYGFSQDAVQKIRNNLNAGRPVIVNAPNHYVVYIGENEDGLIISDPGKQDGDNARYGKTVEDLVNNAINDSNYCGYILITSDFTASSNGSNNNSNNSSSSNQSSTNNQNSSSSNNSSTGTGTARIDDSYNLNNDGYSTIFTSGTTGRQFKEYKQNIPGWDSRYPISCYAATNRDWTGECGLVTTIIVGSGYSSDATFQSATDNMKSANRIYCG